MAQQHYLNRSLYDVLIGIDPDVDKSGVALKWTKHKEVYVHSESLLTLAKRLSGFGNYAHEKALVIIEAGWLNKKKNWHAMKDCSDEVKQAAASKVGRNHQIGLSIVQFCEELGLDYFLYKPTKTKKTKTFLKKQFGIIAKNQEEVDAVMLVL